LAPEPAHLTRLASGHHNARRLQRHPCGGQYWWASPPTNELQNPGPCGWDFSFWGKPSARDARQGGRHR